MSVVTVDFICHLPLELVAEILSFIAISDVLSCMMVCREWHDKILSLQSYWRRAVKCLGVSPYLIQKNVGEGFHDYFTLALKVWKGRKYISSSAPEVSHSSVRFHHRTYFHCTYCRHGTLVGSLYEDFVPVATLVYKFQPGSKRLMKKNQFAPVIRSPLGRICWSNVFCDYLLIATACGLWVGYDLPTNRQLLDWKGPELYDQSVSICCCEYCYLVVTVKLVSHRRSMESYWELDIITLGRGHTLPTLSHCSIATTDYVPSSIVSYGCKNVAILSKVGSRYKKEFCNSHSLILQWANTVAIHTVDSDRQISQIPLKVFDSDMNDLSRDTLQESKHRNTPFLLSSDNSLIGFIFADKLHVWNLNMLTHESSVCIQRSHKDAHVHLLGLGHLYSLIGYESQDGQLKVALTRSGKSIFSTHGFSGVFSDRQQTIGTPPPYFLFLGVVDEHWLNDVRALPHPSMPVILYWEKKEQCVFGIMFKHCLQEDHQSDSPRLHHASREQHNHVQYKYMFKKLLKIF